MPYVERTYTQTKFSIERGSVGLAHAHTKEVFPLVKSLKEASFLFPLGLAKNLLAPSSKIV